MRYRGFDPFVRKDSRILILGSFPSVKSRNEGFYYGNRQNRFWKTLALAFGEVAPSTMLEKFALLENHQIALWDVVRECEIVGSMDINIKNPQQADILSLIRASAIERVLLNGKTAARLFSVYFSSFSLPTVVLPSTSPANPRFDAVVWTEALR